MIRSRKRCWLSLVIVVASLVGGFVWWSGAQPLGLHLRAVLREQTNSAVYVEDFSPDGSLLVALSLRRSGDAIVVWDVASGKVRKVIEPEQNKSKDEEQDGKTRLLGGHRDYRDTGFRGFSPDGTAMVIADNVEGIKFWDTTTWQVRAQIKALKVDQYQFFADRRTFLTRSGQELQVWDLTTGKRVATLETVSHDTAGVESWIAPDEKTLVAVVFDMGDGPGYQWQVNTWDTATWRKRRSIQWNDPAICTNGISPDGTVVAGIDDEGFVRVWDIATGRKLRETKLPKAEELDQENLRCEWCPAGENYLICFASGLLLLYGFEKGQVRTLDESDTAPCEDPFVSWSRDGRTLAFLSYKYDPRNLWIFGLPTMLQRPAGSLFGAPGGILFCSVRRLDVRTGRVQAERWDNRQFRSVAFSPDGSILALGDNRAKVHLFDVPKASPSPR